MSQEEPDPSAAAVLVLFDDDEVDPATIADVVLARPGVRALGTGVIGEPRTLFPGGDIRGLRISTTRVEVHLQVEWHHDLPSIAQDVRRAVLPLAPGRRVDVVIADIVPLPATIDPTPLPFRDHGR